jgi:hypothetical protein
MSAGVDLPLPDDATVHHELVLLAPVFRQRVEAALAECKRRELKVVVYETYRTNALQQAYYARGRTVKPPEKTVTNAKDNTRSWHGYGCAVDVIHEKKRWDMPVGWWKAVAEVFKRHGLSWGGDWKRPDLPHFQPKEVPASPTEDDRERRAVKGIAAVWAKYGLS